MAFDDGSEKLKVKKPPQLIDAYYQYLAEKKIEGSPRDAHIFALTMKRSGLTFGRTVAETVVALEGKLPPYWDG